MLDRDGQRSHRSLGFLTVLSAADTVLDREAVVRSDLLIELEVTVAAKTKGKLQAVPSSGVPRIFTIAELM